MKGALYQPLRDIPPKLGLTKRQNDVLVFLREYSAEHDGVFPTLAQISAHIGNNSKTTAYYLLEGLVDRGHIRKTKGKHRSIEFVDGPVAGLELLAEYLIKNPGQGVTLEYNPAGYSNIPGDERYWHGKLKNPIGSRIGYLTATFPRLIDAIVNERS